MSVLNYADLTEEQWDQLISYYRQNGRWIVVQGLTEARRFQNSMERIQSLAGHSQEQIGEISQAILDMANGVTDER